MTEPLTAEERTSTMLGLISGAQEDLRMAYDAAQQMRAQIDALELELQRLRNMAPGEFEDEWMTAHPFVCGPCERGDHGGSTNVGSLHRPGTFEIEAVARERRQRGECAGRNRSKIRGTTFYCSCEWRPERSGR